MLLKHSYLFTFRNPFILGKVKVELKPYPRVTGYESVMHPGWYAISLKCTIHKHIHTQREIYYIFDGKTN